MIPFVLHEELASTSDEALKLVKNQSRAVPFAVAALKQTAGRGRQGHKWDSQRGGLYISFALPWIHHLPQGLHALHAANILASWIKERFGFHVTLKWPNDVLYAGCKLAGILCESSVSGDVHSSLVIGVGINLKNQVPTHTDYPAISLNNILPVVGEVETLAKEMTAFWLKKWGQESFDEVITHYKRSMPQGSWVDEHNKFYLANTVNLDGSLELSALNSPNERLNLVSSIHSLKLYTQRKQPIKTLIGIPQLPHRDGLIVGFLQDNQIQNLWEAQIQDPAAIAHMITQWTHTLADAPQILYILGELSPTLQSLLENSASQEGLTLKTIEAHPVFAPSPHPRSLPELAALELKLHEHGLDQGYKSFENDTTPSHEQCLHGAWILVHGGLRK